MQLRAGSLRGECDRLLDRALRLGHGARRSQCRGRCHERRGLRRLENTGKVLRSLDALARRVDPTLYRHARHRRSSGTKKTSEASLTAVWTLENPEAGTLSEASPSRRFQPHRHLDSKRIEHALALGCIAHERLEVHVAILGARRWPLGLRHSDPSTLDT